MEKERLQFDFTDDTIKTIDTIKDKIDASSRAEVVRRAINILDYILYKKETEADVVICEPSGRELTLVVM